MQELASKGGREIISVFQTHVVQIYFRVLKVGHINTLHEKFHAEIEIYARWKIGKSSKINKNNFEYDPDKNWDPALYVDNAVDVIEKTRYELIEESGTIYISQIKYMKGIFWSRLYLRHFPFDTQAFNIELRSDSPRNELLLIEDKHRISSIKLDATTDHQSHSEWDIFHYVTTSRESPYENSTVKFKISFKKNNFIKDIQKQRKITNPSKLTLTFYGSRKPWFYLINAFFLIFLKSCISFAYFSIPYDLVHLRLMTTFIVLLTSIPFAWLLNQFLPQMHYLTPLDIYQVSSMTLFICQLIWHSFIGSYFTENLWTKETTQNIDDYILIAFATCFSILHLVGIIWIIYAMKKRKRIKLLEQDFFEKYSDLVLKEELNDKNRF